MAQAKANTPAPKAVVNVVHSEEIWKEHVRHETNSQLRIWPGRWGFLIPEYERLDRIVRGEQVSPRETTTPSLEAYDFKLPPIPKLRKLDPSERYPLTTTQQIGWKSSKKGNLLDFYENAFNSKSRNLFALPKLTLLDSAAS